MKDTYDDPEDIFPYPFDTFSTEDAVVWIDPLDGTSDFVKGNLSAVTVLIGLSIKGCSKIGIVHTPFSEQDPEMGETVFASLEHGAFKMRFNEQISKK